MKYASIFLVLFFVACVDMPKSGDAIVASKNHIAYTEFISAPKTLDDGQMIFQNPTVLYDHYEISVAVYFTDNHAAMRSYLDVSKACYDAYRVNDHWYGDWATGISSVISTPVMYEFNLAKNVRR